MSELLRVKNLTVEYGRKNSFVQAVRDVNFSLNEKETLAIVGESGCGKSTLALSLMNLLPEQESRIPQGEIYFQGQNLLTQTKLEWQKTRGKKSAMIFQDPFSALNPVMTIEDQIQEVLVLEEGKKNLQKAESLLLQVQITDPKRILMSYPHQLSGGQRQRVMIAMALARHPALLIADEPTTALDVTVQSEIILLLKKLQKEMGMGMIFVTHNMGIVKQIADRTAVMYAGQIVEIGETSSVLSKPKHPYTAGLLRSLPSIIPSESPLPILQGAPPMPSNIPSGCPFHPRCGKKFEPCDSKDPSSRVIDEKIVRCHLYPENHVS